MTASSDSSAGRSPTPTNEVSVPDSPSVWASASRTRFRSAAAV